MLERAVKHPAHGSSLEPDCRDKEAHISRSPEKGFNGDRGNCCFSNKRKNGIIPTGETKTYTYAHYVQSGTGSTRHPEPIPFPPTYTHIRPILMMNCLPLLPSLSKTGEGGGTRGGRGTCQARGGRGGVTKRWGYKGAMGTYGGGLPAGMGSMELFGFNVMTAQDHFIQSASRCRERWN